MGMLFVWSFKALNKLILLVLVLLVLLLGHPRRGGLYRSACLLLLSLSVEDRVRVRRSVGRSVGRPKDY